MQSKIALILKLFLKYIIATAGQDDDNKGINNITIEILIDNAFSNDITVLNPVYIELKIW